ncbi:VOC family protein [Granulicoccus sp. GXG6511]|uniref:VOC family protein n=1 Tax=Granulicoccus sp. GXG6511 TaxID=3381351 RepID=UPI003D7C8BAF
MARRESLPQFDVGDRWRGAAHRGSRSGPLRLHLDLNPVDRDQDEELERLLGLGARPASVGQTGEESWHVLADPEGNEFCLLRERLPEL